MYWMYVFKSEFHVVTMAIVQNLQPVWPTDVNLICVKEMLIAVTLEYASMASVCQESHTADLILTVMVVAIRNVLKDAVNQHAVTIAVLMDTNAEVENVS